MASASAAAASAAPEQVQGEIQALPRQDVAQDTTQDTPTKGSLRRVTGWLLSGLLIAMGLVVLLSLMAVLFNPSTTGPIYLALININLIFAIAALMYIGRKVLSIFLERKRSLIGARLQVRVLAIFTTLAVLPALMVALFAAFFLNQGIESWFSNRVTAALEGSLKVAQAYLQENEKNLLIEAQSMAQEPAIQSPTFLIDPDTMGQVLRRAVTRRNVAEVAIYNREGEMLAYSGDIIPPQMTQEMISVIHGGLPPGGVSFQNLETGRLVAMAPIDRQTVLMLSKWISDDVLARMDSTQAAYQEYYELRSKREVVKLIFTLFLILLAAATLAGAIWAGINLAGRIVKPVTALVHATNRVSSGDLDVRITPLDDDELGILTQTFNRMASQLKENRTLLERKNRELSERRRMTEAVLTGVTAGVMSLDHQGIISMANKTARDVLGLKTDRKIGTYSLEIGEMLDQFLSGPHELFQQQVRVTTQEGNRTLLVRMVPQQMSAGKVSAVVVTFDDITELLSAQKVAAWADVAQRIAHEIKNPLTPIQLSAERLRRKYLATLPEDQQEMFKNLTEIIVRQVEDMRLMVNEFSDFARMPAAIMQEEDVTEILQDILYLQREARSDIEFQADLPPRGKVKLFCDRSHLQRAFTNVIENAVNALQEDEKDGKKTTQGHIKVVVEKTQHGTLTATITDNGKGLPDDMDTDHLFDPYVTTRKKGTGLGLAIVRRVVDEHGGQVRLMRRDEGGTAVEFIFPLKNSQEQA